MGVHGTGSINRQNGDLVLGLLAAVDAQIVQTVEARCRLSELLF
jgi:hypothetical protein